MSFVMKALGNAMPFRVAHQYEYLHEYLHQYSTAFDNQQLPNITLRTGAKSVTAIYTTEEKQFVALLMRKRIIASD
jgi:hypothetical protein